MDEEIKGEFIGFRVTREDMEQVREKAQLNGQKIADWCREVVLSEARKDFGMAANERLIYEQVAVIRHLIGYLLKGTLPPEEFEKLKQDAELHKERIAASLMGRSVVKRELETAKRG